MKIEKLIIYGFGKHQNRTIEVDRNLSVFYGPNEAGKTTIQQFIIQTLFGFPARNQSMLRYEPKSGGKYGGQLHIDDAVFGKVIIERVKGKSAGDVTVFFENGTRGGDAELKMVLRDYDRAAFESVFSFSIHELQGLDKMTEEELSRTLLASGTTGIDAIAKMETRLEKEMGLLFKKGGRNPAMNVLIEELREIENELKEYRTRTELYGPYLERLREVERRLEQIGGEEQRIGSELKQLDKWLQTAPLIDRKKSLENEIGERADRTFPADGMKRMDRLMDRMSETKAKIGHAENEISATAKEDLVPQETEKLERLLNRESEWHRLRSVLREKQEEARKLEDDVNRLLALVGMSEREALQSDVSLGREEQLIEHIQKADLEEEERRYRQRKLAEEQEKISDAEKELALFLQHKPSEKEREIARQWPDAANQLAEAKAAKHLQKATQPQTASYVLMALGIFGIVIGFLQANVPVAIGAILAAAVGLWLFAKNRKPPMLSPAYEKVLQDYAGRETEMETLMWKVEDFDRKHAAMAEDLAATRRKAEKLSTETGGQAAKKAYRQFLLELGIDSASSRATVLDLFERLREIHALCSRRQRSAEDVTELTGRLDDWMAEAAEAAGKRADADDLYALLRSEYNKRQQLKAAYRQQQEKLEELSEQSRQLHALSDQLEKERQLLLAEAGAEGTEDFYRLHDEWTRKEEALRELSPVESQLAALGETVKPADWSEGNASHYANEREAALTVLAAERKELLTEQADKQQTIKNLLSDEAYEEKLQQFEEKKTEFTELAKQWSVDKAITQAIKQTMDELKEKKLPSVIAAAQQYFWKLTSGAYSGLEINPEGYFEAVAADGLRFHIAELSQATKEQAYIALRLSLAVSMKHSHPFPIIMDDAFVHFDRSRLQQVINLLTELQTDHQFVYFTCHDPVQQGWPAARIIDVVSPGRRIHS